MATYLRELVYQLTKEFKNDIVVVSVKQNSNFLFNSGVFTPSFSMVHHKGKGNA